MPLDLSTIQRSTGGYQIFRLMSCSAMPETNSIFSDRRTDGTCRHFSSWRRGLPSTSRGGIAETIRNAAWLAPDFPFPLSRFRAVIDQWAMRNVCPSIG